MWTDTRSYQHEDVLLACDAPPIALRPLRPEDAPRFRALLAADAGPSSTPLTPEQAAGAVARMQESARVPTVVAFPSTEKGKKKEEEEEEEEADDDERNGRARPPQVVSGPGRVNLAVIHTPTATLIGLTGYGAIHTLPPSEGSPRPRRAGDAGVVIDPAYRNRGIAVACMRMTIDWGFRSAEDGGLALDFVTVTTSEDNEKMRRLADRKLGLEGRGVVGEGGPTGREVRYELTKGAWEELRRI